MPRCSLQQLSAAAASQESVAERLGRLEKRMTELEERMELLVRAEIARLEVLRDLIKRNMSNDEFTNSTKVVRMTKKS